MNDTKFLDDEESETTNMTCSCGYGWDTGSKLMYVSCPSCGRKCYNITKFPIKKI